MAKTVSPRDYQEARCPHYGFLVSDAATDCPGDACAYIIPPNGSYYECPTCGFYHLKEGECPSGKCRYEKKIEALLCIVHWEIEAEPDHPRPIRAYLCPLCNFWHVTSQLKRPLDVVA